MLKVGLFEGLKMLEGVLEMVRSDKLISVGRKQSWCYLWMSVSAYVIYYHLGRI